MANIKEDLLKSYDEYFSEPVKITQATISNESVKKENILEEYDIEREEKEFTTPLGFDIEDYSKYLGEVFDPTTDIEERRALAQSGWKLLGNALGQGITEATLGALEGIGYVLDFEELINADAQAQEGFDNWFSKGIREAKEYVQEEVFPVYQTHRAMEGSFWERMGDATFWAAQGRTVGTTLSLLIPSAGVARGIGLAGRAMRLGETAATIGQGVSAAMFSRKAESAMEANQTFQTEYQRLLGEGLSDEEARLKAGEAASTVFSANAAMLPLDMIQYTLALKTFKGLKAGLDDVKATKAGRIAEGITQMGTEAMEEAYQFTAQQEAVAAINEGITPFGEGFGERLGEYVKDPEFQTAAFLGGAMGGLFQAVSPVTRKIANVNDQYVAKKLSASNLGDIHAFNKIDNKVKSDIIIKNIKSDRLDILNEELDELETANQNNPDISQEEKTEVSNKIKAFKQDVQFVKDTEDSLSLSSKYADKANLRKEYALLKWEDKVSRDKIKELEAEESTLLDEFIDARDNAVYVDRARANLKKTISKLKKDKKLDPALREKFIETYEREYEELGKNLESLKEDARGIDPDFKVSKYTSPNIEQLQRVSQELFNTKKHVELALRPRMAEIENMSEPKAQEEEAAATEEAVKNAQTLAEETAKADAAEAARISKEEGVEVLTTLEDVKTPEELDNMERLVDESTTMSDKVKKDVKKQIQDKRAELQEKAAKDKVPTEQQKILEELEAAREPVVEPTTQAEIDEAVAAAKPEVTPVTPEEIAEAVTTGEVIGTLEVTGEITPTDKQNIQTAESREEPDTEITKKDQEQADTKELETLNKKDRFDARTTQTNIAYLAVEHRGRKSKLNAKGEIEFVEDSDHRTALDTHFLPNSEIVMFIDTEYKGSKAKGYSDSYENTKDNPDAVPIAIQLKEDYGKVVPTMYLHRMDWVKPANVAEEQLDKVKEETKALREYMFKNQEPAVSFTTSKSPGYANRSGKERTVNEIVGNDTRPVIGFGTRNNTLDIESLDTINEDFVSGVPYLVLPTANGTYFATWLRQREIKTQAKLQKKYNETVVTLLEAYATQSISELNTLKALRAEIGKYYHVNTDRLTEEAGRDIDKGVNTLFHVNESKDGTLMVQLIAPDRKGVWFRDYRYVDGKWQASYGRDNWKTVDMVEALKEKLSDKFPNITKEGVKAGEDFEVYELVEGKLVKNKVAHNKFLSDNKVVTSRIQPLEVEGTNTYFSQSNIGINTDVNKLQPLEVKEAVNPEPISDETTTQATQEEEFKSTDKGEVVKEVKKPEVKEVKEAPKRPSKLKRQTGKKVKPIKFKESTETEDLVDANDIDYNRLSISSFTLLDNVQQENDIVRSMTNIVLQNLDELKAEGKPASIAKAQEMLLEDLQKEQEFYKYYSENTPTDEVIEEGAYEDMSDNAVLAENIKGIIDNFNRVEQADKIKFVGYGFRITHDISSLKYTVLDEVGSVEEEMEKANYSDSWAFKQDPERSLSAQVKRSLSFIPSGETNSLGYEIYYRYDEVFNYIANELADIPLDNMYDSLTELAKNNDIAAGVLEELEELEVKDAAAYNKFFVAFRKQEAMFEVLRSYPRDKDGRISYHVIKSNRSGAVNIIVDSWHETFKTIGLDSGLLKLDTTTGQLSINTEKGKEYNKQFKAILKQDFKEQVPALTKLLNDLGIDISEEAIEKLNKDRQDNKPKFSKYYTEAKTFKNFLQNELSYIFNTISGVSPEVVEEPFQKNNPFYSQIKRLSGLAAYNAEFKPDITSSSFRNANNDVIFSFVMPQHASNRMQKIKRDENYRNELKKVPFIINSTWLDQEVNLSYFDASKNAKGYQPGKGYNEQSPTERELTKIGLFQKSGKKAIFIGNTPSDKTTFPLYEVDRHVMDLGTEVFVDGEVKVENIDMESETFNALYNLLVQSEVNRINVVNTAYNTLPKEQLIPGYHYMRNKDGKEIIGGGNYFFFIPELNDAIKPYRTKEGIKLGDTGILTLKEALRDKVGKLIQDKVKSWGDKGVVNFDKGTHSFDKSYATKIANKAVKAGKPQNIINMAAADLVTNYMMSYVNQFQLVTGDPALFTKPGYKFTNYKSLIGSVADNLFKRTAKDIAPGLEGKFESKSFNTLFINEPVDGSVMTTYKKRLGNITETYEEADIADAQEWTTLEEHLEVMFAFGKISKETRDRLSKKNLNRAMAQEKDKHKYNFTWEELATVLTPMKPVYVTSAIDEDLQTDVHYYIKTSSFPLIPQMTEGLEIDELRDAMETFGVDRAVVKSGVKTGFKQSVDVFDGNKVDVSNIKSGIQNLTRDGFRIQQEVPHDFTKNQILEGSQLRKLKFANLTTDLNFSLRGRDDYKGYELKRLDDQIHTRWYELKYDKLLKKLGVKEDFNTIDDVTKLRDLLRESAINLGYGYNDLMLLNTITMKDGKVVFDIPLFFHNQASKIESMLNSIIKNKVLKNKMSGLSFVQGSSAGFESQFKGEEFAKHMLETTGTRIAYTKHYKGDNLDYREYEENGKKIIYGEVFAPFYFLQTNTDGTKQPALIKDYVDDNGFIREDKIDDELLNILGYRIPTQGHNSMIKLKIVGFLPQEAGNLIIVPGAITKQMGSDFDVDKLYTHFYNYTIDKGKLTKVQPDLKKDPSELTEEELQNLSMDITYSILANETVQNKYQFESVDNPALVIDKDGDARTGRVGIKQMKKGVPGESIRTKPQEGSIAYEEFQSHMVGVNAAGKIGIGSFSTASVNHILFQYAGVSLKVPTNKKGKLLTDKAVSIMFKDEAGNILTDLRSGEDFDSNRVVPAEDKIKYKDGKEIRKSYYSYSPAQGAWRLDKVWTFENPVTNQRKSISEVISYYQSASVDNAKDQHLFDLHQNKNTFGVTSLIARAGFDEMFINRFINQPIIIEYVKRIVAADNFTETEFDPNKLEGIQNQLFSEYGVSDWESLKLMAPSMSEMEEAIKNGGKDRKFQAGILYNFIKYNEVAKEVGRVQRTTNVDTAYLGKSIYSSILKQQDGAKKVEFLSNVQNLSEIDGELTTQGGAIKYGLNASIGLFSDNNLFPINSPTVLDVFDDVATEMDRDINEDLAYSIMNDMRSSIFSNAVVELYGENIADLRKRLLFGENSLAKRLLEHKAVSDNLFIQALSADQSYVEGEPDVIEFAASKEIKEELDFSMLLGWNELLNAPEGSIERTLGEDLVKYALVIGNQRSARDFGRFLPYDYIKENLSEYYQNINFYESNEVTDKIVANFVTQWFQHNPYRARHVERIQFRNATNEKGEKIGKDDIPYFLQLKSIEEEGMESLLTDSAGDYSKPKYITLIDNNIPYLYMEDNSQYIRIPTLGLSKKLIKEYNLNEKINASLFGEELPSAAYKDVELQGKTPIVQSKGSKIFNEYNFNKGITAVLDGIISKSASELNIAVAKFYKDKLDLIKDYSLEVFDESKHHSEGKVKHPRGRTQHKQNIIAISNIKNDSVEKFEETILHEITHAMLQNTISVKGSKELQGIINSLDTHKDKLSDVDWLKSIGVENINNDGWSYKDQSFKTPSEFTSFLMSSPDFQKILDNIELKKDKSFLQRVKEIVLKLLGVDLGNTKLAEGVSTVINIIEDGGIEKAAVDKKVKDVESNDLIDGHAFPVKKPVNKYIKSALVKKLEDGKEVYTPFIQPHDNRRWVTNNFFRYQSNMKPYYPFGTGVSSKDISLVHEINDNFVGGRVVYYSQQDGVIKFTPKSELAVPRKEAEEVMTEGQIQTEEERLLQTWRNLDSEDLFDPDKDNATQELIARKESIIEFHKKKLTERGVNRSAIKAKISTLEKQVQLLKEKDSEANVLEVIKATLKTVKNELVNTQSILESNPDSEVLLDTMSRLETIDLYIEGIRDADKLLKTEVETNQREYDLLSKDIDRTREEYGNQLKRAIAALAKQVGPTSFEDIKEEDLFGAIEDINFATRELLSITNSKSALVKFMDDLIHKAEYNIRNKQREIATEVDSWQKRLEKHTGKKGMGLFDIFLQKYDNGQYTGNTIGRYKQEFFDTRSKMYDKYHTGAISAKELRAWLRANTHTITREELKSGKSIAFSEAEMEQQAELLKQYEEDLAAYREQIESAFTDEDGVIDMAGVENAVEEWKNIYSPYLYIDSIYTSVKYNKKRLGNEYLINSKPIKKWEDKRFDKLMKDDKIVDETLYGFYKFMKETFAENNRTLPFINRVPGNYLPELKKSFIERTKDKGFIKGLAGLKGEFLDALMDDVEGTIDYDIQVGNRKFKTIPVRMMGNILSAEEKSLDIFRVIKQHSAMANAYKHKSRIEPILSASQQLLEEMDEVQSRETAKGKKVVLDKWGRPRTKTSALVNTRKQLEHAVESFLYDSYRDVEGRIGKPKLSEKDKAKLAELEQKLEDEKLTQEQFDAAIGKLGKQVTATGISDVLNKYTYLNALGFPNFITPSVNLTFGIASNLIYASGNEVITLKDMRKSLNMFMGAVIDKRQLHKVWAWMEELGVLDDFNETLYGTKKTLADKSLFLQNNTERINRGTMMLAHLNAMKLKDKNGNEVSIYHAFKEVDRKLIWNTELMGERAETTGKEIVSKDMKGVDLYRLTRLIERVNHNVHGDYESALRGKRTVVGRTLFMFKTWLPMSIMYRFGNETYDDQLQRTVKGRYRVAWTAKTAEGQDIKTTDFLKMLATAAFKKNGLADLSEVDRAAVRRNLKELQFIAQFTIAILALSSIETDDEEEKFALNMMINFLTKAQADLSFFTDPKAMAQIMNNVAPVYTTVRNIFSLTDVAWEMISGNAVYERGPYRDKNRAAVWGGKMLPGINPAMRMWNYGDKIVAQF